MQIFIDAEGNATIVTPQHIYQGSNISQINVISLAFTPQTTLQIAFVLPDGTTTNYYPMSFQYSQTVNYYQYIIQQAFTAQSGSASIALLATDSQTQQQTSQLIPFTIEPSVLPTLPDTPSQDEWTTLLQYVQQNMSNIATLQATISDIENIANTANANASQAVETANEALSIAQQAETTANDALDRVVEAYGTAVTVGGQLAKNLSFDSDPQTQIDQNADNIEINAQKIQQTNNGAMDANVTKSSNITGALGGTYVQIGTDISSRPFMVDGYEGDSVPYPKFAFDIIPYAGGGAKIIQKVNETNITEVILDGTSLIFYIESGTDDQIFVNYTFSNNAITPKLTILSDYTPSDEAVVFDCTSTGFETDNIAANNIDTEFINGQPVSQIGGGISLVSALPTPTQAEYNKHLLYLYAGNLEYLTEVIADEPVVTTPATLPFKLYMASACTVGTDCYIFGGVSGNPQNRIIKFDSISQTATTLSATLPTSSYQASACAVGTNCYVFGGYIGGTYYDTIIKFDSVSQTVTTLSATLPNTLNNTSACAVGTDCYIFGGYDGSRNQNTIIKFDSVSQTVTTLPNKLPNRIYNTSACAVGTDCYIFGGYSSGSTDTIFKFDSVSQTATTLSATLPYTAHTTSACAIGTDCYIFGGNTNNSVRRNTIIKFDSVSQTVTTLSATLPNNTEQASACAVGTNCYVFGGYTGSSTLNSIVQVAFGVTYTYKTIQTQ